MELKDAEKQIQTAKTTDTEPNLALFPKEFRALISEQLAHIPDALKTQMIFHALARVLAPNHITIQSVHVVPEIFATVWTILDFQGDRQEYHAVWEDIETLCRSAENNSDKLKHYWNRRSGDPERGGFIFEEEILPKKRLFDMFCAIKNSYEQTNNVAIYYHWDGLPSLNNKRFRDFIEVGASWRFDYINVPKLDPKNNQPTKMGDVREALLARKKQAAAKRLVLERQSELIKDVYLKTKNATFKNTTAGDELIQYYDIESVRRVTSSMSKWQATRLRTRAIRVLHHAAIIAAYAHPEHRELNIQDILAAIHWCEVLDNHCARAAKQYGVR